MFNKFYVFVPSALHTAPTASDHCHTSLNAEREHLVREAQEAGMQKENQVEVKKCA